MVDHALPRRIGAFVLLALLPLPALAQHAGTCAALTGCERKACEIGVQIRMAERQDNPARLRGLRKALSEVEAHCSDTALKQDREDDIQDLKHDIEEDEQDLLEARNEGKADKVRKYQERLRHKRSQLQRLEQQTGH